MGWGYYDYKPYVSVAQRQANAAAEMAKLKAKGTVITPVKIEGRTIARTFWGQAWCKNLEGYGDYENRLPRGRTYVCNGSVVDLQIKSGKITSRVSGSELYEIKIDISELPKAQWQTLKEQCAGKVGSLVELLQGKLSTSVMEQVTNRDQGLFPKPTEIKMRCSCPDSAGMCKHIAATMYGVGNRLDASPELLFTLRGVDHHELIEQAIPKQTLKSKSRTPKIAVEDLSAIFDIEMGDTPTVSTVQPKPTRKLAAKKVTAKATTTKTTKKPAAAKKKSAPAKKKPIPKKG